jgi:hypothetical protein
LVVCLNQSEMFSPCLEFKKWRENCGFSLDDILESVSEVWETGWFQPLHERSLSGILLTPHGVQDSTTYLSLWKVITELVIGTSLTARNCTLKLCIQTCQLSSAQLSSLSQNVSNDLHTNVAWVLIYIIKFMLRIHVLIKMFYSFLVSIMESMALIILKLFLFSAVCTEHL